MTARFDDSLPALVTVIAEALGRDTLENGVVLRDATGRLAFFSSQSLDEAILTELSARLCQILGSYARGDRVVAGPEEYGATSILEDGSALRIEVSGYSVRVLDRRLAGADWLRSPAPASQPPLRYVFTSIKGGVGRSTSLAVTAAELAKHGLRVLVVDLDLEAPGLGPMLLDEGTLPKFGVLDALVENGISGLDDEFLSDLIGPSALAKGHGRIDVMPVLGKESLAHPADVLAKIARAYVEDIADDGKVATILDQIRSLIDCYADSARYDAILVDSRAGLHETSAAALLGLGAEVFLFGLDEPQTYQGFKVLLAHLARFPDRDWLDHFTIVQGKAPAVPGDRMRFAERCQDVLADVGLVKPNDNLSENRQARPVAPEEAFDAFDWNDELPDEDVLPKEDREFSQPIAILDDPRFRGFDPIQTPDLLSEQTYRSSFELLLQNVLTGFRQDEKAKQ